MNNQKISSKLSTTLLALIMGASVFLAGLSVATAQETPQYGGTATLAFSIANWVGGPPTWDQAKWIWSGHGWASLVFDSFMVCDFHRGPSGTGETEYYSTEYCDPQYEIGLLAESWEVPDPETYIFNIRQGVKFHNRPPVNGRAVTAKDVEYHFDRVFKVYKDQYPYIVSARATGEYAFEIKTNEPVGFWSEKFGHGFNHFIIQPREAVEAEGGLDSWKNARGTGPYIIEDYVADSSVTFSSNPDWYMTWNQDGKEYRLPFVDKMVVPIIAKDRPRQAALRTGKIDMVMVQSLTTKKDMADTPELIGKTIPLGGHIFVAFRVDRKPLNDIRVRQALNMAVDRQAFSDAFQEGQSIFFIGNLQPGDAAFTPLEETPEEIQMLYKYNPSRAEELLDEAGYPRGADGIRFKLEVPTQSPAEFQELTEMLIGFWSEIGVESEVEVLEYAAHQAQAVNREYENLIITGVGTAPADGFNYLSYAERNFSMWDDKIYDEAWGSAAKEMDPAKRTEYMRQAFLRLKSQATHFRFPSGLYYTTWWPWLKNFDGASAIGGHKYTNLAYVWIDQDLKREMGF